MNILTKTIVKDIVCNAGRLIEWSDASAIYYDGPINVDCEPILVTQTICKEGLNYTEKRNYSAKELNETIRTGKIRWFHAKDEPIIKPEYKQKTLFD